ncbi:sigma-70 family RNA polymerase sigma factor [Actinocatenispora rupis]|uniref:DNA-directed RNA polymerase sigma-70 factor n=1 Tax=Actinocatenispora rupis TaxID=519421 RepID=A0A8J3NEH8_9ACTN|nr:sigma-70 family RNA polymerase sigma factor [Actinocatenispora rupis]GID14047.1 DNA-directed RNA polymerase sigma-70 factor [Actinocatenispora rupis]
MGTDDGVTARFEAERARLLAVAYRMLGSAAEAEDAVQEAWLRLDRADVSDVRNLPGWLTTVLSRICLDLLRARVSRREDLGAEPADAVSPVADPETEAVRADEVGRALLVVLDRLGPAERVAFVLHDMFAVPFDDIAYVVDRSPVAAKKLASRARTRVRGTPVVSPPDLARHRRVVEAFLAAARSGDLTAILAVLDPDAVRRGDRLAVPADRPVEVRGARAVAGEIAVFGRNARFAEPALVDGAVGVVVAPRGRLRLVLLVSVAGERVAGYELVADPDRLRRLDLAVLD